MDGQHPRPKLNREYGFLNGCTSVCTTHGGTISSLSITRSETEVVYRVVSTKEVGNLDENLYNNTNNVGTSRSYDEIKMIHSNCQSAMNKKTEIKDLLAIENPMILALTEFGASSEIQNDELNCDGYSLYRGDHSDGRGGPGRGTALYVHNSLNHSACPKLERLPFDCSAWCQIKLNTWQSLLIGTIYRSPNSPVGNNEDLLKMLKEIRSTNVKYITICGDFNVPHINWGLNYCNAPPDSFNDKFLRTINDLRLDQHVQQPT